jgi:hypothetical protein
MLPTDEYQHLEPRSGSNYRQLWVKGRHIRAEVTPWGQNPGAPRKSPTTTGYRSRPCGRQLTTVFATNRCWTPSATAKNCAFAKQA